MLRHYLESSVLASVGYDRLSHVLEVEFKHGGVYRYFEVPETSVEELMTASSHGAYFGRAIRNRHRCRKM